MGRSMFSIILLAALLCGCADTAPAPLEPPLCRVVTQVEIREEMPFAGSQRLYRSQENINRILTGITKLGHKFQAGEMPPPWERESYRITLYFSDGNQKIYRYHPLRYLYIQRRGWTRINEDRSADFLSMLQQLPEE